LSFTILRDHINPW